MFLFYHAVLSFRGADRLRPRSICVRNGASRRAGRVPHSDG
jgi:hypothetical protein